MAKGLTTVLEITQTHVKLVQSKSTPTGKAITLIEVKDIIDTTDQTVSKVIKEIISASKIDPENLICIIPRSSSIVRNLRLPSQDPAEIENILDFQIKQQIPYAKEDIVSDYIVTGKDEAGFSDVLLVTVHKSIIQRYLNILNLANISPDVFSLSSLGISNWYSCLDRASDSATLLVSIDSTVADLCLCYKNNLTFSRSVSFGLSDISEEKQEGFIEQLHLTLSTYRKDKNSPDISRIALVAQSDKLTGLSQKLQSEFSLPVEIIDPLESVPKDTVSLIPVGLENVSVAAVLGLALSKKETQLNLLPEDIHEQQKAKSFKKDLVRSLVLLILVLVFATSAVLFNIYKKQRYSNELDSILKEMGPSVEMAEASGKKLSLIKDRLSATGTSIDIIYELYNILPAQMSLNVFSLDEKDNVTLQGVSNQMSEVFSFQSSLEKSNYFKNIEVKYASKRKTRQGEITDFRITCQVNRE